MMPFWEMKPLARGMRYATIGLLPLAVVFAVMFQMQPSVVPDPAILAALPMNKAPDVPWVVLSESQVASGVTVPANTNVIFHIPSTANGRLPREVLLGSRGRRVRYWGYCLPLNYDPAVVKTRKDGYPGLMFLSEKERDAQKALVTPEKNELSVFDVAGAEAELSEKAGTPRVRHQLELFDPGSLCYIMTETPLPIGLDQDGDLLNSKAELDANSDPLVADTDGDGLPDGAEVMSGTLPTVRDSDSDGLIDGLEDQDFDGRFDRNESDPLNKDSDRDGLCDGLCLVHLANNELVQLGEDLNLDGKLDPGETSPISRDTNGDGLNDYDARYRCLFEDTAVCP